MIKPEIFRQNLQSISEKVEHSAKACGRSPDSIQILAITKSVDLNTLAMMHKQGVREVGENRWPDCRDKIQALHSDLSFHMVGSIQNKKASLVVRHFDVIHSVDSLELAVLLSRAAEQQSRRVKAFLQVNVLGESSKHGLRPEEAKATFAQCLSEAPHLEWIGLMAMAPAGQPNEARKCFTGLRTLRDHLSDQHHHPLPQLSMGMSHDFEIAIEEGSTLIRIGRALFQGPSETD